MKALFLDIDEVLNSHASRAAFHGRVNKARAESDELSPVAVGLIRRLCIPRQTTLIVSSTWRIGRTALQLANMLRLPVDDVTPVHYDRHRGREIREWLSLNPVDDYVVIDDGIGGLEEFDAEKRLVRPKADDGFQFEHYRQCCRILNIDPHHFL